MATLAPIVGSLGLVALIVGLLMLLPLKGLKSKRGLAIKIALSGSIAFVAGLLLTPETSKPSSPEAVLPKGTIKDAGLYPPALNLEIDFGNARSGQVIEAAGNEIASLGRKMIHGPQPITDSVISINFTVLGGEGPNKAVGRKLLHLTIKTDTMRLLARRGATSTQFLDAADEVGSWSPNNDDVVNAYCLANTVFCRKLKSST